MSWFKFWAKADVEPVSEKPKLKICCACPETKVGSQPRRFRLVPSKCAALALAYKSDGAVITRRLLETSV